MPAGTCPTTMRNDCKSKNRGKPKEAETLWYKRAAAGQESFNEPIMRALSLSLSLYFVLFFYLSLYLSFPLSLSRGKPMYISSTFITPSQGYHLPQPCGGVAVAAK